MRPADALAKKRILIEHLREWRPGERGEEVTVVDGSTTIQETCDELGAYLPHCRTYYVAPDMAAVAKSAGATLPLADVGVDALPAADGFILFDGALTRMVEVPTPSRARLESGLPPDVAAVPVCGVAWTTSQMPGEGPQVFFTALADMSGLRAGVTSLIPVGCMVWTPGEGVANTGMYDSAAERTLLATFLLMRQSLTVVEPCRDRMEEKRFSRAGLSPDCVSVIRLRRRSTRPDEPTPGGVPGNWSHRWIVDGHWRNQPYPSEGVVRPKYIEAYEKGPGHLPLVVKDKVTAWVR